MIKKIILTNCVLSPRTKRRLMNGIGANFVLRNVKEIKEPELNVVEIMLVDTMEPSIKEWMSMGKTAQMPSLKFIQSVRAGVDAIDFGQLPESVKICGNVGAYSEPMAEHALGIILYLAKYLGVRNNELRKGVPDYRNSLFLKGKTIGVIGAGGIGQAIARISKCLGMRTLGVNTSGKQVSHFDRTYDIRKLDRVLAISDVVVLALSLTVKSFRIINREKLQRMKKNCILINVARGQIIDEESLYNHMLQNPEFKCGLDVWWRYPEPGGKFAQSFPFFELPNFVGTPHVSGFVPEERDIALNLAVDNVIKFVKNKKLKGLVNREDYKGLRDLLLS